MVWRQLAPVYTYSKFVPAGQRSSFVLPEDTCLFAHGVIPSSVLSCDLPAWYVHVEVGKVGDSLQAPIRFAADAYGYVSARGVEGLLYVPSYCMPMRACKADALFVSYTGSVRIQRDSLGAYPSAYDCVVCGFSIAPFLRVVREYSEIDVSSIEAEMNVRRSWIQEGSPAWGRRAYVFAPLPQAA